MTVFVCPTSPVDDQSSPSISYAGNIGSTQYDATAMTQYRGDGVMLDAVGYTPSSVAYSPARNGLDMISSADGATMTLLFAEKCGALFSPQAFYDTVPSVIGNAANGLTLSQMTPAPYVSLPTTGLPGFGIFSVNAALTPVINSSLSGLEGYSGMPSAMHPGGILAVFCDGHTVFLRDNVDVKTYAQLLTSNSKWSTLTTSYQTNGPRIRAILPAEKLVSEIDFQ